MMTQSWVHGFTSTPTCLRWVSKVCYIVSKQGGGIYQRTQLLSLLITNRQYTTDDELFQQNRLHYVRRRLATNWRQQAHSRPIHSFVAISSTIASMALLHKKWRAKTTTPYNRWHKWWIILSTTVSRPQSVRTVSNRSNSSTKVF